MALNVEQERARVCDDNCLVLAPPGSGKTGTLVQKAKHIIQSIPGSVVLLVTFTDASSKEARERLSKLITPQQMRRVTVATFHSHAMEQLRRAKKLGRILSPHESKDMLRRSLSECASTMDLNEADSELQAAKSTPDFTGTETDFIASYEQKKLSHRAIDLQDVVREAVVGMRSRVPEKHVPPLPGTHVLCDEFQDVDWNQLFWLLEYHALGAIVTVVGDDDQSVYGFRNSLGYDAMAEFINRTTPTVIHLEVNYRSNIESLAAATQLIRNNTKRMDKVIASNLGPGGAVYVVRVPSKEAESTMMVEAILTDAAEGGFQRSSIPKGRWGIIGRNNRDLWLISAMLRSEEIPFTKSSKKDDAPYEIMMFCGCLVSIQSNDSVGLRNTLSAIGVSDKTIRNVQSQLGDEFYQVMDGVFPGLDEVPIEERDALKLFLQLCPKWREFTGLGFYSRVIGAVGDFFLAHVVRGEDSVDDFKNFVRMLSGGSKAFTPSEIDPDAPVKRSLQKKVNGNLQVRVMNYFRQEDKKGSDGVSLHTMHGSKGLEFENVYMVQCNSGTIPSAKATSVEEERRLFYVGMTRAKHKLTVSSIGTKGPSSFISQFHAS